MKYILMGDTHLGVKKSNPVMMARQLQGWDHVIEYAKSEGISTIIHEGDFFDDRAALTIQTINAAKLIAKKLKDAGLKMIMLTGNHDVVYKNRNDVNSPEAVFGIEDDTILIFTQPTKMDDIDIIPWVNHTNLSEVMEFVEDSDARFCIGHFEFSGFPFHKGGRKSDSGMSIKPFRRYEKVFSGHYHTCSSDGNIFYTGSSFEFTWADWNDLKIFTVLDTDSGEARAVAMPKNICNFMKVVVSAEGAVTEIVPALAVKDRFVRVLVDGVATKKIEALIVDIEKAALEVEVIYAGEVTVDKDVVVEEVSAESIEHDVVAAAVSDDSMKSDVLTYIESLKRAVA